MKACAIRFKTSSKSYLFKYDDLELNVGDFVIVETEKGTQYGKVMDVDVENTRNIDINKMKPVSRIAESKDEKDFEKNLKNSKDALEFARKKAEELGLDMRIVDASYTLDKKQLTFNFVADERIDFRDLVKELAARFKTRIELHQMGVRDKAKEVGGLGPCGRCLCCTGFLNGVDTISINMAKNQNIALNPTKINGLCGRLLCCLSYEDDVYTDHRKCLPKMGEVVKTSDGEGKVVSLDVLNKKYSVNIDGDIKEYDCHEYKKRN